MLRFQFSKIKTWKNFIILDFPGVEDFIGVGLLRSSDADESLENFVENCVLIFIKIVKIRKWLFRIFLFVPRKNEISDKWNI